jgi:hypothetical protein
MLAEYDAWEHMLADAFDGKSGVIALLTSYFDATDDPTIKGHPNRPLLHGVSCYFGLPARLGQVSEGMAKSA